MCPASQLWGKGAGVAVSQPPQAVLTRVQHPTLHYHTCPVPIRGSQPCRWAQASAAQGVTRPRGESSLADGDPGQAGTGCRGAGKGHNLSQVPAIGTLFLSCPLFLSCTLN